MRKRGLSSVITTLIIILIVLVAIGLIWVVVSNIIEEGSREITLERFNLNEQEEIGPQNVQINYGSQDTIILNAQTNKATKFVVEYRDGVGNTNTVEESTFSEEHSLVIPMFKDHVGGDYNINITSYDRENNFVQTQKVFKNTYTCNNGRKIGDIDNNNFVDNADSQIVLNMFGGSIAKPLDTRCVDVDSNGYVDNADSQLILNHFAGSYKDRLGVVGLQDFENGLISEETILYYFDRAGDLTYFSSENSGWSQEEKSLDTLNNKINFINEIGLRYNHYTDFSWKRELFDNNYFKSLSAKIYRAHQDANHELIFEAGIMEYVNKNYINQLKIPKYVFQEFGLSDENRNFNYDNIIYLDGYGVDEWAIGESVPDITRIETQMYFYYLATKYIDAGFESIWYGQINAVGHNDWKPGDDPDKWKNYISLTKRIRNYAKKYARRGAVIFGSHYGEGSEVFLDFTSLPSGLHEHVQDNINENTILYNLGLPSPPKASWVPGGQAFPPTSKPHLVDIDNWECNSVVQDDITKFTAGSYNNRNQFLDREYNWIKTTWPNARLMIPLRRYTACNYGCIKQDNTRSGKLSYYTAYLCGETQTIKNIFSQS